MTQNTNALAARYVLPSVPTRVLSFIVICQYGSNNQLAAWRWGLFEMEQHAEGLQLLKGNVAFAEAAQTGRLVSETDGGERAALEVTALVAEIDSLGLGRIVR